MAMVVAAYVRNIKESMVPERRLMLIGCSKTKKPHSPDPRRGGKQTPEEMYGGALFAKQVAYANHAGILWRVLSAEYGMWQPDSQRKPYDATMSEKSKADFAVWHVSVAHSVLHELWEPWESDASQPVLQPKELVVEIHAGRDYAHPLAEILRAVGVRVELPCEGLGIGDRLALYTSGKFSVKEQTN